MTSSEGEAADDRLELVGEAGQFGGRGVRLREGGGGALGGHGDAPMLAAMLEVQSEASPALRLISLVVAVCSSTALAMVTTAPPAVTADGGTGDDRVVFVIDATSPVPPFEQLRVQFARQIQDRTLPVGYRLPTIRSLATDLGLAANTVARTYRELEEAGLIETRGRAGSFVSAAGEAGRERARRAAADYAAVIVSAGIGADEAVRIVQAALSAASSGGRGDAGGLAHDEAPGLAHDA